MNKQERQKIEKQIELARLTWGDAIANYRIAMIPGPDRMPLSELRGLYQETADAYDKLRQLETILDIPAQESDIRRLTRLAREKKEEKEKKQKIEKVNEWAVDGK